MIKLKEEINKTAIMRDLRKKAEQMYKHTYEGKLRIEDFMSGANTLFNLLRLPRVSKSVKPVGEPTVCEHKNIIDTHNNFKKYCKDCEQEFE